MKGGESGQVKSREEQLFNPPLGETCHEDRT